ncbi:MAG: hypothetical protein ACLRIS_19555 [Flavonifractor plautii]
MSEYGAGANWSYGNFVVIDHGTPPPLRPHVLAGGERGQMVSQADHRRRGRHRQCRAPTSTTRCASTANGRTPRHIIPSSLHSGL